MDVAFDMHTRLFGLTYLHAMLRPGRRRVARAARGASDRDAARACIGAHQSIITAGGDWARVVLLDNDVRPE